MGKVVSARAYANNEVAYVAWQANGHIKNCLGFEVTRVYLDDIGKETGRARCASWVGFKGQRNPHWLPQDTGIWPVQKFSWRDLTLRKKRDGVERRPGEVHVRYEIRPVGDLKAGMEAAPSPEPQPKSVVKRDAKNRPVLDKQGQPVRIQVKAYEGKPRPLGYLGPAVVSNPILITQKRGPFRTTFTNGILAAQWLSNVLLEDGSIGENELIDKLQNPDDLHRKYLAGDVIPLIHELFSRKGKFYLGLYELEDAELEEILVANAKRIHVILSNTGEQPSGSGIWDARNKAGRKALIDAGVDIQHRMFNNSTHIGHNKFVVHVPPGGQPRSVLTGSTNWTSTGLAAQTNNAILIEDDAVAGIFLDYWKRMKVDALKVPKPFSKGMKDNQQSADFRESNREAFSAKLGKGARLTTWFSPNMLQRKKSTSKTKPNETPPDLAEVYRLMRQAKEAILFLAFYPAQSGRDCIIGEAIDIGIKDRSLLVTGAVSSPQAMPNYRAAKKEDGEVVEDGESPSTFDNQNVSIVRAAAMDDRRLIGDFVREKLTAKKTGAIIHDKLVVIDPRSPDCHVILGSHNLGFKASYSNDENMVIVSGHQALAEAYAVHILDVYDHYRFRAIETERKRLGKKPGWSGFLATDDDWQAGYVEKRKGALMRYFAG